MSNEVTEESLIKIDVGFGAKIEVKTEIPPEASARAVNALVDAISPFTEVLGLAGDQIRAVRQNRAIERALAARNQLEQRGLPIRPVPDSFLLPWIERTSQDEGDGGLTVAWEGMLASASQCYESQMKFFPSILSDMTNQDVSILDELVPATLDEGQRLDYNWPLGWLRTRCFDYAEKILNDQNLSHFDQTAADKFLNEIGKIDISWPTKILGAEVPFVPEKPQDPNDKVIYPNFSSVGLTTDMSRYDNLLRLRLLEIFRFTFISGFQIEVMGVMATSLGVNFIKCCRGVARPTANEG